MSSREENKQQQETEKNRETKTGIDVENKQQQETEKNRETKTGIDVER